MKKIVPLAALSAVPLAVGLAVPASAGTYAPGAPTSRCQPNGTGCAKAGEYVNEPSAQITGNHGGFEVTWSGSTVQPYSSGVPLYWQVGVIYTNVSAVAHAFSCPSAGSVKETMSGGSGDDGYVTASSLRCKVTKVYPHRHIAVAATFHNVPWPGSAVSITWGSYGSSPAINPYAHPLR